MKREIKFRSWNIEKKIMADVSQLRYDYTVDVSYEKGEKKDGYFFGGNWVGDRWNKYENILMQFTGLKDRNGKDIYECDVLSEKWKVEVFQNNEGTFMVRSHINPKINKPMSLNKYLKSRIKAGTWLEDNMVIGNIHENPELLK